MVSSNRIKAADNLSFEHVHMECELCHLSFRRTLILADQAPPLAPHLSSLPHSKHSQSGGGGFNIWICGVYNHSDHTSIYM